MGSLTWIVVQIEREESVRTTIEIGCHSMVARYIAA
jgi:hypothetical protein